MYLFYVFSFLCVFEDVSMHVIFFSMHFCFFMMLCTLMFGLINGDAGGIL